MLLHRSDAPLYTVYNPFICTSYRAQLSSRGCAESVFSIHNESCNIWTHLIGVVLVFITGVYVLTIPMQHASWDSTCVVALYFIGGVVCMASSALLHCYICYSPHAASFLSRLDHACILLLLAASDLPMIYFGFTSHPLERCVYMILMVVIVAIAMKALLSEHMQCEEQRMMRLGCFIGVVVFGWVQMTHEIYIKGGIRSTDGARILTNWCISFGFYAVGVIFYATHIPERFNKHARFDIWVHSLFRHACA